jgi:hypothetical protein
VPIASQCRSLESMQLKSARVVLGWPTSIHFEAVEGRV